MRLPLAVLCFSLFLASPSPTEGGRINTLAGGGSSTDPLDGGLATEVRLVRPTNLAMDASANIYIVEEWGHRVRKFDRLTGRVTRFAGTGVAGFSGDLGPASEARLNHPYGITFDSEGSLYLSDTQNNRIRRIDSDGVITTYAGDGFSRELNQGRWAGDGRQATEASFNLPLGIATDDHGNLFIADERNHVVRRVDPLGFVSTFAGEVGLGGYNDYFGDGFPAFRANFNRPAGLAVGHADNLLIVDRVNNRVRNVDASGLLTSFAGDGFGWDRFTGRFAGDGGPATLASFYRPAAVTLDSDGNVYISDTSNHRVRRIDQDGTVSTIAGSGGAGFSGDDGAASTASLHNPTGLLVDIDGSVLVADWNNDRIRRITPAGTIHTAIGGGNGDGFSALLSTLDEPSDAVVTSEGIVIAERSAHRIRLVQHDGRLRTIAGNGTTGFSGDGGHATEATLNRPSRLAVDRKGAIYFTDWGNKRVRRISRSGIITTVAGTGFAGILENGTSASEIDFASPIGIAIDLNGDLLIVDRTNDLLVRIDSDGILTRLAGTGDGGFTEDGVATESKLNRPEDVAVDQHGTIYIADTGNHRIRKLTADGNLVTVAGSEAGEGGDGSAATEAKLNFPRSLTVDGSGRIFVSDERNDRVRVISADGIMLTVAGNGTRGYGGDGLDSSQALLSAPRGLAIDTDGHLLIADTGNARLRRIEHAATPRPVILEIPQSPSDFTEDGIVDFSDFLVFVQAFGSTLPAFDLDDDGLVAFGDFLLFAAAFGE
jgi:trimeric autotransporter adhesin